MSEVDDAKVEAELRGKALRVYWYFIRHSEKPLGVREVQRALGFSSPSVAMHHLEKLKGLELLKKNASGEYLLAREVKVGFLRMFTRLGRVILPRYLFYAVFISTMLATYVAVYPQNFNIHNIVALTFGVAACVILWYETVRLLREAPF